MSGPITYAKALGPPDNWADLCVLDRSGNEVPDVVEVNTEEGWLIRFARDEAGHLVINKERDDLETERIEGEFRIVERAQ